MKKIILIVIAVVLVGVAAWLVFGRGNSAYKKAYGFCQENVIKAGIEQEFAHNLCDCVATKVVAKKNIEQDDMYDIAAQCLGEHYLNQK